MKCCRSQVLIFKIEMKKGHLSSFYRQYILICVIWLFCINTNEIPASPKVVSSKYWHIMSTFTWVTLDSASRSHAGTKQNLTALKERIPFRFRDSLSQQHYEIKSAGGCGLLSMSSWGIGLMTLTLLLVLCIPCSTRGTTIEYLKWVNIEKGTLIYCVNNNSKYEVTLKCNETFSISICTNHAERNPFLWLVLYPHRWSATLRHFTGTPIQSQLYRSRRHPHKTGVLWDWQHVPTEQPDDMCVVDGASATELQ